MHVQVAACMSCLQISGPNGLVETAGLAASVRERQKSRTNNLVQLQKCTGQQHFIPAAAVDTNVNLSLS